MFDMYKDKTPGYTGTMILGVICSFLFQGLQCQPIESVTINQKEGRIEEVVIAQLKGMEEDLSLVSFRVGDRFFKSSQTEQYKDFLQLEIRAQELKNGGWSAEILFRNISKDTLRLHNVVPLGEDSNRVYITGLGDHSLSRTHLFRPGYKPVNVIVPDNSWELGYSALRTGEIRLAALTRRTGWQNAVRRRFETAILPGGEVRYRIWMESFEGNWQSGLRKIFQEKLLFDVETFNNSLYTREDLKWVRNAYLCQLMMAWDHDVYDAEKEKYTFPAFVAFNNRVLGGADIYGLWPTWPALGMDQRNQWDMYRNMPGGIEAVKGLADVAHTNRSHFYIAFKPWDTDTRKEDPYKALAEMIGEIGADGVVLDCSGASSEQLREAADNGGNGVVMYSEGMAVPKDMQGIVSGRVHNALYYCPLLNLNKLIKPEFSIFRVVEIGKERVKREYALSLFNGYGTENNLFAPGRPYWLEEQWNFLGKILMIQRENSSSFLQKNWEPLIHTLSDDIYVNKWPSGEKTLYTLFSLIPGGYSNPLFEVNVRSGFHCIDLWNHEPVAVECLNNRYYASVDMEAFAEKYLGTNNEGAPGVIAEFPELLETTLNLPADRLTFSASRGDKIRVWAGMPGYQGTYRDFSAEKQTIRLMKVFGRSEGKFVVQLFEEGILLDENIVTFAPASARLISRVERTKPHSGAIGDMVKIPGGEFRMETENGDEFIPYPGQLTTEKATMPSFYMDRFPVTNRQFKHFLDETGYVPEDPENFLNHWKEGRIVPGDEDKPVVFISYEDARVYASWAGKRLPTEREWQYAAQTSEGYLWPWGDQTGISSEKTVITGTLTVEKLTGIDTTFCNPGNGTLDPVGSYPEGENPYGLQDLVGSVWQMTNDVYDNGTYSMVMLKGGSFYKPESSWWYVQGGPKNLRYRQMLLRVSQGFERKATVGFRCVADE
jgi:gamma-glutamyl hercynylcysteine S-oxide synthase